MRAVRHTERFVSSEKVADRLTGNRSNERMRRSSLFGVLKEGRKVEGVGHKPGTIYGDPLSSVCRQLILVLLQPFHLDAAFIHSRKGHLLKVKPALFMQGLQLRHFV